MTEVQRFTVFAPVVMAGIGKLPATIQDRSVVVMMRRKAPHEKVDKYRIRRDRPGLQRVHERVSEWSKDVRDVAKIYASNGIDIPVDDRQADVWEPLLIVAQLAGGNWPDTAREACKVMCANTDAEDSDSPDLLLLGDVRDIFGNVTFIRSSELVSQLKMLHDSPWFDEMLTPARLSSKLRGYGIHPRHSADKTRRGYYRADFRDTWIRYLSPENSSEPSEPSEAGGDQGTSADTFRSPDTVSDTRPVRDTSSDAAPSAQTPSSDAVPDTSDTSDGFRGSVPRPSTYPTPRWPLRFMHRTQAQSESVASAEYRPIAGFDGYDVSADRIVWSVGRTVQTKGGVTRTTAAKELKPDDRTGWPCAATARRSRSTSITWRHRHFRQCRTVRLCGPYNCGAAIAAGSTATTRCGGARTRR